MTNYQTHELTQYAIGPLQRKMLEIIKQEKEIPIIEIGKRLGKYPHRMTNVHGGLQQLEVRGLIEIRLPKGHKRNYTYAVFVKDYEEPQLRKENKLTEYDLKERYMRQLIKNLQIIKKYKKSLQELEDDLLTNHN